MGCANSTITDSEAAVLEIGELLHEANEASNKSPDLSFQKIRLAETKLPRVDLESQDHYAILVHSREGKLHFKLHHYSKAIEAYTKAVHIAEVQIEQKVRGLYLLLQRYAECMVDIASIWLRSAGLATNEARRLAEYGKAELVLLRCIETIEEGHNRRSDLLIEPINVLARLYETIGLFSRAELLIRRVCGILIVQFGHEHPQIAEAQQHLDHVIAKKDALAQENAATKIQSVVRMRKEMRELERKTQKPAKRHVMDRPKTPDVADDFLSKLAREDGVDEGDNSEPGGTSPSPPQAHISSHSSGNAQLSNSGDHNRILTKQYGGQRSNAGTISPTLNPLDAATSRARSAKSIMEPVLQGSQAPPRLWTVDGAGGDADGDDDGEYSDKE